MTTLQDAAAHATEVARGDRFEFGKNWSRFLSVLDDARIQRAEDSLRTMLGTPTLEGQRFLDIGSGSGLFSLAARRLGAHVHSLDYDTQSVACTRELRRRYFPEDPAWTVEQASVLDAEHMRALGLHDVVYSWGVLHHTGRMWEAMQNTLHCARPGGLLFIAIYNDRGAESARWQRIKRTYCALPAPLRPPFAFVANLPREARELAKATLQLRPWEYVHGWTRYGQRRGMSRWHDIVDWVGGYPYEYATPEQVIDFHRARGFEPVRVERTNGLGCNQFVFRREDAKGADEGGIRH